MWVLEDFPDGELTPLFNLPDILADPDKPVVMVEGEKAAEAAASIFGDNAVASANADGARGWQGTDLGSIAGRSVILWRDNDDPGRAWEVGLGEALIKLGCRVFSVDVEELIKADGGARGDTHEPIGWDADDAASEWSDTFKLRSAIGDLTRPYEPPPKPAATHSDKPPLCVSMAYAAEVFGDLRRIITASAQVYDRNGPTILKQDRLSGGVVSSPLSVPRLQLLTHELCQPYKYNAKGEEVDALFPELAARMYLSYGDDLGLPLLKGITSAPLISADGSIRTAQGYDASSCMFCVNVPDIAQLVPEYPTRTQSEAALRLLREALGTFAYRDAKMIPKNGVLRVDLDQPPGADESAGLHMLLSTVARACLDLAPANLIAAPERSGSGVGKGKYAKCCCVIAFGHLPVAIGPGNDEDEREKRIFSAFLSAASVVLFDNWNNLILTSNNLASVLTERPAGIRQFRTLDVIVVDAPTSVFLTGNGLSLGKDLSRRNINMNLDARMENPELRAFPTDALLDVRMRRAELLVAALTILRYGRRGGRMSRGAPLGSYEQWGEWVRDPLLTLGCQDPVLRVLENKQSDVNRQRDLVILDEWWQRHKNSPVLASELHSEVLRLISPRNPHWRAAVAFCNSHNGTRVGGYILEMVKPSDEAGKRGAQYRLSQTGGDKPEVNTGASQQKGASQQAETPNFAGDAGAPKTEQNEHPQTHERRDNTQPIDNVEINISKHAPLAGDAGTAGDLYASAQNVREQKTVATIHAAEGVPEAPETTSKSAENFSVDFNTKITRSTRSTRNAINQINWLRAKREGRRMTSAHPQHPQNPQRRPPLRNPAARSPGSRAAACAASGARLWASASPTSSTATKPRVLSQTR